MNWKGGKIKKECLRCNKQFEVFPCLSSRKFCGMACSSKTVKNKFWLGKHRSEETNLKISISKKGTIPWNKGLTGWRKGEKHPWFSFPAEKNVNWKGDKVGYRALHNWVESQLGKPDKCENCKKIGYGRSMHWANVSREYKRDIKDWRRLCPKCHKAYDKSYQILKQSY